MEEKKYLIAINTYKGYKVYWNGYTGFCKHNPNISNQLGFPLTKEDKRYKQGFKRAHEVISEVLGETVEVIELENSDA